MVCVDAGGVAKLKIRNFQLQVWADAVDVCPRLAG